MQQGSRLPLTQLILVGLLLTIVVLQLLTISGTPDQSRPSDVHTVVLKWDPIEVAARSVTSGYVAFWRPQANVRIVAVQVWMGNPSGILWEGDVYVTLNNQGDFHSPDQVIVHYQFDKHAETSAPHQVWFQIGSEESGFYVSQNQTIWVWRAFNNISDDPTMSADGQIIIYYQLG